MLKFWSFKFHSSIISLNNNQEIQKIELRKNLNIYTKPVFEEIRFLWYYNASAKKRKICFKGLVSLVILVISHNIPILYLSNLCTLKYDNIFENGFEFVTMLYSKLCYKIVYLDSLKTVRYLAP